MISQDIYTRIRANNYIADKDKALIYKLFDVSNRISFGKISSRREGYLIDGIGYPRCTNVLQMDGSKAAALMEWAKREVAGYAKENLLRALKEKGSIDEFAVNYILDAALDYPDRQKNDAATEGTAVHDNVENWLNKEPYEDNRLLQEFIHIWQNERVELIATEIPLVWHQKGVGFGGKLDILAYKDGKFIIYDNKTSRSVHDSYGCQVAAYKNAVEQMSPGLKVSKCKIIHLANEANMSEWQKKQHARLGNLIEITNMTKAWKHFKALLELYEMRNNKYF